MNTHQGKTIEVYNYGSTETIISINSWEPYISITAKRNKMKYSIYIMKLPN